ncbi:MAG: hypothetical protein ABFR62_04960 [Bacteroidota bacterium]
MRPIFKYTLLVVAFVMFSANLFGIEKERVVKKSFKANSSTELNVENSFGDVNVESYSGNEIYIEVKIWAKGSSEERLTKFINDIDINFKESIDMLRVKTSNISNNGKVDKFRVDYKVKVPYDNDLAIKNSFGNVYIAKHKAKVELDVSHGDFEIGSLLNESNEIELKFGDGEIEEFKSGELDLSHSKLSIGKAYGLILESKFSNTKVERVEGDIKAKVSHGGIVAKKVAKGFNSIAVKADFSKVKLYLDESAAYSFNYKGSFSSFNKPNGIEIKSREKGYTSEAIQGEYNGGGSEVKVMISHSSLSLD